MLEGLQSQDFPAWWVFLLSLGLFVGSLIAMPILVARMRPDYFVRRRRRPVETWEGPQTLLRWGFLLVKNLLGLVLLLAGIAMLVLPGQGIITILIGISLLNFPGKRRLELLIVRQRPVLVAINWIRERARQPPLVLPRTEPPGPAPPEKPQRP